DARAAIDALRRAVKDADPSMPLRNIEPMDDVVGARLAARRFALGLAGSFAGLALVLATLGIYGVLAYEVPTRTRLVDRRALVGNRGRRGRRAPPHRRPLRRRPAGRHDLRPGRRRLAPHRDRGVCRPGPPGYQGRPALEHALRMRSPIVPRRAGASGIA